uniref:LytR family transcriptional regulator n=1 Tax=candidate division WOR-3 bacterium TaxID=2052148 RepID=A0A7C4CEZ2_UNCW3
MRRAGVWALSLAVLLLAGSTGWRFLRRRCERLPVPTYVRIDVVNGSGVARAGRDVMREMLVAGFNVYAARNSGQRRERTAVVDRVDRGGRNARAVAEALKVPRSLFGVDIGIRAMPDCVVDIDSTRFVDVEVVIGSDYRVFFPGAGPNH